MGQEYRRFSLWTCGTGLVLGIVAMSVVYAIGLLLPAALDGVISLALVVPDKFGFVEHVSDEETVFIESSGTYLVPLLREGTYYVFSPRRLAANTTITLTSAEVERAVEVTSALILNDNNPFPTSVDKEAPQFVFNVATPGQYQLLVDSTQHDLRLTIVPYVGDQNTRVAFVAGAVQVMLIVFVVRLLYHYLNREHLQREKAFAGQKRNQLTAFLDRELDRRVEEERRGE